MGIRFEAAIECPNQQGILEERSEESGGAGVAL